MLPITVFIVYIASHAVASAATVPLPEKIYYDLDDAENLFQEHVELHQRKYNDDEYSKRFELFQETLRKINDLNAKYPRTVFKVTHFADLTQEERQSYLGLKRPNYEIENKEFHQQVQSKEAPDSFDWRKHGAVTPVKDQGACGSCYIFSAIGNIEGQYAIKHKQTLALSEQQCLDCLPKTTCVGGLMVDVMKDLANRTGCMTEADYPYLGKDGQKCKEDANKVAAKVIGGGLLNISSAEDLKQKVYNIGPLAVALDAHDFDSYSKGILHPDMCSSDIYREDHAVLLVGYGEEEGEKYWIIKNSWGTSFGENGYVRLLRGVNACGIENTGTTATAQVA